MHLLPSLAIPRRHVRLEPLTAECRRSSRPRGSPGQVLKATESLNPPEPAALQVALPGAPLSLGRQTETRGPRDAAADTLGQKHALRVPLASAKAGGSGPRDKGRSRPATH